MEVLSLENLTTGSKIKIQVVERRLFVSHLDNFENPKNPEISIFNETREYSFCWKDIFKETELIILGNWNNKSDLYEACIYPSSWFSNDSKFIVKLPDFKYHARFMKDSVEQKLKYRSFYDINEDADARILARAIDFGQIPEQIEIMRFRIKKPYSDIFNI